MALLSGILLCTLMPQALYLQRSRCICGAHTHAKGIHVSPKGEKFPIILHGVTFQKTVCGRKESIRNSDLKIPTFWVTTAKLKDAIINNSL